MYIKYNANPAGKNAGDCTIRALCLALNQSWEETYAGVAVEGLRLYDMPSANHVWGAYLRGKGFTREMIPDERGEGYTVANFCKDNPRGIYVLALSGHVVGVIDGNYYDTWDSGNEIPIYFWKKEKGGK